MRAYMKQSVEMKNQGLFTFKEAVLRISQKSQKNTGGGV